MDSNSQSPSICQRLINLIFSTLNRPRLPPGSSRNGKSYNGAIDRPNGYVGSEVVVEFRHTDGTERWIQIDGRGGSILDPKKNGLIMSNAHKVDHKTDDNRIQEPEALAWKDLKNIVTIQDGLANESNDGTKSRPTRRPGHLLSVASNINEKSDAFIESRKKAMDRNYSFDQDNDRESHG